MSKDDDKDIDPNTLLIPREMTERKRLLATSKLVPPPLSPEDAAALRRFEILPSNAISTDVPKASGGGDEEDCCEECRKKKNVKGRHVRQHAHDPSHARGGVCPTCGHRFGGGSASGKVTVSGDNYLHLYQEQQKASREDSLKIKRENALKAQNEALDKRKEEQKYAHAHSLQDQIGFWKSQAGLGNYDDALIQDTVTNLERQLFDIPQNYWK